MTARDLYREPLQVLTTIEVAELLRVSEATVGRRVKAGRLKPIEPHRPYRFNGLDILALIGVEPPTVTPAERRERVTRAVVEALR